MIDKRSDFSSKNDIPSYKEENEVERGKVKLLYQNTRNPERDKSSGLSSDEETTSSSLLPLPSSLKQMRSELKKTFSDIGELSEIESSDAREDTVEKVRQGLNEIRRKFTLKNEASVASKMNSANLMLDDILSNSNVQVGLSDTEGLRVVRDVRKTAVLESKTSTTESTVSSQKLCRHNSIEAVVPHTCPPVAFISTGRSHEDSGWNAHCTCPVINENDTQTTVETSNKKQLKKSWLKKIQDFKSRYRILSTYAMMQKTKPFPTNQRGIEAQTTQKGILGAAQEETPTTEEPFCKYNDRVPTQHYPKKMICDLVASSNVSQSDSISNDGRGDSCSVKTPCLCQNKDYTCREVPPECICDRCTCPSQQEENVQNPSAVEKDDKQALQDGNNNIENPPESSRGPQDWRRHCTRERKLIERTDFYYFDHGNSAYYQTTDHHPVRYTECLVERTDEYATKFWAEFFGAIEIGMAFLISFILQLYRFLFTSIIRSLTVGLLQIFSDYFFKPLLTIAFNGIIQPCLILAYNIATSLRDLCLPISQIFGFFAKEVAHIFKALRIVEVNHNYSGQSSCNCGNKV